MTHPFIGRCWYCAHAHRSDLCPHRSRKTIALMPLETPSHNGPWRGTLPVRVIEPGVFGTANQVRAAARLRGRLRRWANHKKETKQ